MTSDGSKRGPNRRWVLVGALATAIVAGVTVSVVAVIDESAGTSDATDGDGSDGDAPRPTDGPGASRAARAATGVEGDDAADGAPRRPGRAVRPPPRPGAGPSIVVPHPGWKGWDGRAPERLTGAIDTKDGSVAGAEITVDGRTVGTASDGSFRIDGLAPGDHVVEIRAEGFVPRTLRWRSPEASAEPVAPEAVRWFLEPGVDFRVALRTADGNPVEGAPVALIPERNGGRFVATSDANGTASFRDVPAGRAHVWVHPGRAQGRSTYRFIKFGVAVEDGATLELMPSVGDDVRGVVTDVRGAAVAGAQVVVLQDRGIPAFIFPDSVTDAAGVFALGLPGGSPRPGLYVVAPATDGTGWRYAPAVVAVPAKGDVAVCLEDGVVLEGRILGPGDVAVARRDVELTSARQGLSPQTVVRTDDAGRFRVWGLVAESYSIRFVEADGGASGPALVMRRTDVRPGVVPVEVRAARPAGLDLRIVDSAGNDVKSPVRVRSVDGHESWEAAAGGRVRLRGIPAGRYEVLLLHPSGPLPLGEVETSEALQTLTVP